MKIIKTTLLLFSAGVFFLSCKKNYLCNCEYKGSNLQYLIKNERKSDAEISCKAYEDQGGLLSCELE